MKLLVDSTAAAAKKILITGESIGSFENSLLIRFFIRDKNTGEMAYWDLRNLTNSTQSVDLVGGSYPPSDQYPATAAVSNWWYQNLISPRSVNDWELFQINAHYDASQEFDHLPETWPSNPYSWGAGNRSINGTDDILGFWYLSAPVLTTSSTLSTIEDTASTAIAFSATDYDGDTLTYLFSDPAKGSIINNNDGTYTYTPDTNANGSDSFTITVSDGTYIDTQTVVITINAVNDVPVLTTSSTLSTNEDTATAPIAFSASDADGDPLTYSFSDPAKGV